MRPKQILVINPNSNQSVTDGLARALAPFEIPQKLHIICKTLHQGPFGIESDEHIRQVIAPLSQTITAESGYDAYVIACYSDPGLEACRQVTTRPVFGIQSSALSVVRATGKRFGVLALQEDSIKRHLAYIENLGMREQLAGERPLGISVDAAANDEAVFPKMIRSAKLLIEEDGAEVLILGCAGMAAHRSALEDALGVVVIEPTQAAVGLARGLCS